MTWSETPLLEPRRSEEGATLKQGRARHDRESREIHKGAGQTMEGRQTSNRWKHELGVIGETPEFAANLEAYSGT